MQEPVYPARSRPLIFPSTMIRVFGEDVMHAAVFHRPYRATILIDKLDQDRVTQCVATATSGTASAAVAARLRQTTYRGN